MQELPWDEDEGVVADGQLETEQCALGSLEHAEVGESRHNARPYSLVQTQTYRGRLFPVLPGGGTSARPEENAGPGPVIDAEHGHATMADHSELQGNLTEIAQPAMGSSFFAQSATVSLANSSEKSFFSALGFRTGTAGAHASTGAAAYTGALSLIARLQQQVTSYISFSVQSFKTQSAEAATFGVLILVMVLILSIILMLFMAHTLNDQTTCKTDQEQQFISRRDASFDRNIAAPVAQSALPPGAALPSPFHSGRGTIGDAQVRRASSINAPSPMMVPAAPSSGRQSVATSSGPSLCPELVVPDGSECVLAMPSFQNATKSETLKIADKSGLPLLRVTLELANTYNSGSAPFAGASKTVGGQLAPDRVSLLSAKDGQRLAYCDIRLPGGPSDGRDPRCSVFRPSGDLHANLWEDLTGATAPGGDPGDRSFIIGLQRDPTQRLHFYGDMGGRRASITDASQQLVATVERGDDFTFDKRGGDFYRLRVAPQADAGLIIVALLTIDRVPRRQFANT